MEDGGASEGSWGRKEGRLDGMEGSRGAQWLSGESHTHRTTMMSKHTPRPMCGAP